MSRFLLALCLLVALPVSAATKVLVTTNIGSFTVELNEAKAPITTKNFLRYVDDGSYVALFSIVLFPVLWRKVVVLIKR